MVPLYAYLKTKATHDVAIDFIICILINEKRIMSEGMHMTDLFVGRLFSVHNNFINKLIGAYIQSKSGYKHHREYSATLYKLSPVNDRSSSTIISIDCHDDQLPPLITRCILPEKMFQLAHLMPDCNVIYDLPVSIHEDPYKEQYDYKTKYLALATTQSQNSIV